MEYDRYTSAISAQYQAFASAMLANYLTIRSSGRGMDGVSQFRLDTLASITRLLGAATTLTNDYLAPMGEGAITDARESPWLNQLRNIAIKNMNDLIVKLMGGGARPADLLNRPAGAVGLLLQKKMEAPALTVRDRAGRSWPADKMVATSARDFAYQAYLDAEIERMDEEGVEMVDIVYPNPNHANHGMTIRLAEVGLVRKKIFHPNSNARLVPHVQA